MHTALSQSTMKGFMKLTAIGIKTIKFLQLKLAIQKKSLSSLTNRNLENTLSVRAHGLKLAHTAAFVEGERIITFCHVEEDHSAWKLCMENSWLDTRRLRNTKIAKTQFLTKFSARNFGSIKSGLILAKAISMSFKNVMPIAEDAKIMQKYFALSLHGTRTLEMLMSMISFVQRIMKHIMVLISLLSWIVQARWHNIFKCVKMLSCE